MSRGLDHIVHAAHDLDAAADLYRRLGFTVGARNRHAWGTHNHIVQLPGFFVELLTVAEPEKLGTDGFSALFGTFNRLFLKQQEGLSLLILESRNAIADASDFRAAKIGVSDAMRFEREAKRPDGSTVKVGFSLAFARDPQAPQIGFAEPTLRWSMPRAATASGPCTMLARSRSPASCSTTERRSMPWTMITIRPRPST